MKNYIKKERTDEVPPSTNSTVAKTYSKSFRIYV